MIIEWEPKKRKDGSEAKVQIAYTEENIWTDKEALNKFKKAIKVTEGQWEVNIVCAYCNRQILRIYKDERVYTLHDLELYPESMCPAIRLLTMTNMLRRDYVAHRVHNTLDISDKEGLYGFEKLH